MVVSRGWFALYGVHMSRFIVPANISRSRDSILKFGLPPSLEAAGDLTVGWDSNVCWPSGAERWLVVLRRGSCSTDHHSSCPTRCRSPYPLHVGSLLKTKDPGFPSNSTSEPCLKDLKSPKETFYSRVFHRSGAAPRGVFWKHVPFRLPQWLWDAPGREQWGGGGHQIPSNAYSQRNEELSHILQDFWMSLPVIWANNWFLIMQVRNLIQIYIWQSTFECF